MRFHYGFPPEADPPFANPRKIVVDYTTLHVQALLVSILAIGPILYLACRLKFGNPEIFGIFELGPLSFLGLMAATIFAHELIHLFSHPFIGLSRQSYIGVLPKSFLVYASYQGLQTRSMLLLTLLAPFSILTVLPIAACWMGTLPKDWISAAIGVAIINGMAASGDLIQTLVVIRKIPSGAMIRGEYYGTPIKDS